MNDARYLRLPSRHLDRRVHLWTHGWWGTPVIVFPSAAGMAHEWQLGGAIDALRPLLDAGRIKLYCPESNVSTAWRGEGPAADRLAQHRAYERFITEELLGFVRADCELPSARPGLIGASFGAFYAANFALKRPDLFDWALCLSGRYDTAPFIEGADPADAYFDQPLSYVPGLRGADLAAVHQTHLTLVVGLGPFEGRCVSETAALARVLAERGIPHHLDVWGHDVSHEWVWWRRQLLHHLGGRLAA
jgi:esterase/lipase superfamily enzyme